MGLALMYSPCKDCQHRPTHEMCSMCELMYLRNYKSAKEGTLFHTPKDNNDERAEQFERLKKSFDWEKIHLELEKYIDEKFESILHLMEEQDDNREGTIE